MASNTEVAHNWANQTGRCQNGSNFYYSGDTLYSYGSHFVVGVIINGAAILTTKRYSVSTAKHVGYARSACSHMRRIFCKYPASARDGSHEDNINAWNREFEIIKDAVSSSPRKSLVNKVAELENIQASCQAYINHFGIKTDLPQKIAAYCEELRSSERYASELEKNSAKAERKAAKEAAEKAEQIEKFRNGLAHYVHTEFQMLRVESDVIYTSLGVKIGHKEFSTLYKMYTSGRQMVGTKVMNSFTIISSTPEIVKIGCHKLLRAEIDSAFNKIQTIADTF